MNSRCLQLRPVLTALMMLASFAQADRVSHAFDVSDTDLDSIAHRLDQLESELASLRCNDTGYGGNDCCGNVRCSPCCCPPVWYAGGEVLIYRPHVGGHLDTEAQPRFWIGRERSDGLGFRTTLWWYEHNGIAVPPPAIGIVRVQSAVEAYAADLELTQRGSFRSWDVHCSGGARIAGIESREVLRDGFNFPLDTDFDGAGLTFALAAGRRVTGPIGVFSSLRGSLLYGSTDVAFPTPIIGVPPVSVSVTSERLSGDKTVQMWEMQLGVEYTRRLGLGELSLRTAVEAQQWDTPVMAFGLGDPNFGLIGVGFGVALAL